MDYLGERAWEAADGRGQMKFRFARIPLLSARPPGVLPSGGSGFCGYLAVLLVSRPGECPPNGLRTGSATVARYTKAFVMAPTTVAPLPNRLGWWPPACGTPSKPPWVVAPDRWHPLQIILGGGPPSGAPSTKALVRGPPPVAPLPYRLGGGPIPLEAACTCIFRNCGRGAALHPDRGNRAESAARVVPGALRGRRPRPLLCVLWETSADPLFRVGSGRIGSAP
jgi:hypothetical protein